MTTHNAMKPRSFVPLSLAVHLVLARAELAEVLGCAWHNILEELEHHTAEWLACFQKGVLAIDESGPSICRNDAAVLAMYQGMSSPIRTAS